MAFCVHLGRFTVGQNIGWTTIKDWSFVMEAWFSEHQHFEYGIGSTDGGPIGHYTQVPNLAEYCINVLPSEIEL